MLSQHVSFLVPKQLSLANLSWKLSSTTAQVVIVLLVCRQYFSRVSNLGLKNGCSCLQSCSWFNSLKALPRFLNHPSLVSVFMVLKMAWIWASKTLFLCFCFFVSQEPWHSVSRTHCPSPSAFSAWPSILESIISTPLKCMCQSLYCCSC